MRKIYVMLISVTLLVGVSLTGSQPAVACEKGSFENLHGPKDVQLGQRYTYSVYPRGKFQSVNWSAAGGQVVKTWNDGKTYFADVRWTHIDSHKGTRVKVWGKDDCGTMRDARFRVSSGTASSSRGQGTPGGGSAQFYEDFNGGGANFSSSQSQATLSSRWDNVVSSIWVPAGSQVTIYQGANYQGPNLTLQGGQNGARHNLPNRFNNNMSSFKI